MTSIFHGIIVLSRSRFCGDKADSRLKNLDATIFETRKLAELLRLSL